METIENKAGIKKVTLKANAISNKPNKESDDFLTKLQGKVKKLSKDQISNSVTKNKGGKQKFKTEFLEQWKKDHSIDSSSNTTVRNQIRNFIFSEYAIKIADNYSSDNFVAVEQNCKALKQFFQKSLIDWTDYKSFPCFTGEKKADKNKIMLNAYELFSSVYDLKK